MGSVLDKTIANEDIPDGWWESVLADTEFDEQPNKNIQIDAIKNLVVVNWDFAESIYHDDQIIDVEVKAINRGGLLVEGNNLAGFIPCSHLVEYPVQTNRVHREANLGLYLGKILRAKIIECDVTKGRIVFSERAARAEPGKRTAIFDSLRPGDIVKGEVTNLTDFGAFIDLGGAEGLIHISELSWGRVIHPQQVLKIGHYVEVMVVDISVERNRIALSLKRLYPNPWDKAGERYPLGGVYPAVITGLVPFGAFAKLKDGLEGLIHISEIPLPANKKIQEVITPGQLVTVRVVQVDSSRQRLGLSLRTSS